MPVTPRHRVITASIASAICMSFSALPSLAAPTPTAKPAVVASDQTAPSAVFQMTVRPNATTSVDGSVYVPATGFQGGWYSGNILSTVDIVGTNDDVLYRPEWTNPKAWTKSLTNGLYDVTLKFREGYARAAAQRVFSVSAEGNVVLPLLDVYKEVGRRAALEKTFRVEVKDNLLNVNFNAIKGLPIVSMIVVKPVISSVPSNPQVPAPEAITPPTVAAQAGFGKLSLRSEFDSLADIDTSGQGKPGYQWYTDRPYGWPTLPASALNVSNSVLTINPEADYANYCIGTLSPSTGSGQAFKYGYYEAKIRFDPANATRSSGWPSFWGFSKEHMLSVAGKRSGELDIFEAWHDAYKQFDGIFVGTLHDWDNTTANIDYGTGGNNITWPKNVDWSAWHTYSVLWTPGRVSWFMDGQMQLTQGYSASALPTPNTTNAPLGAFSIFDQEQGGQGLILGSGPGFPIQVDWVRVWGR